MNVLLEDHKPECYLNAEIHFAVIDKTEPETSYEYLRELPEKLVIGVGTEEDE